MRLRRLNAGHFLDNPASGRVLTKLGFRPTGVVADRFSVGRGEAAPCRLFELELGGEAARQAPALTAALEPA
jgi:RimJ/RimL family protein N-acetyltransferase